MKFIPWLSKLIICTACFLTNTTKGRPSSECATEAHIREQAAMSDPPTYKKVSLGSWQYFSLLLERLIQRLTVACNKAKTNEHTTFKIVRNSNISELKQEMSACLATAAHSSCENSKLRVRERRPQWMDSPLVTNETLYFVYGSTSLLNF